MLVDAVICITHPRIEEFAVLFRIIILRHSLDIEVTLLEGMRLMAEET